MRRIGSSIAGLAVAPVPRQGGGFRGALLLENAHRAGPGGEGYQALWTCDHNHRTDRGACACAVREVRRWAASL